MTSAKNAGVLAMFTKLVTLLPTLCSVSIAGAQARTSATASSDFRSGLTGPRRLWRVGPNGNV